MMKYEQLLNDNPQVEKDKRHFQAKKAKKQLESAILDMEEELVDIDLKLNKATGSFPFDVNAVIDAEDSKALVERKLTQAKKILETLFSDTKKEA